MKRIPDIRVKKGCCILTILDDGTSFLYKYPPGSLLSPSSSNLKCPIMGAKVGAGATAVSGSSWEAPVESPGALPDCVKSPAGMVEDCSTSADAVTLVTAVSRTGLVFSLCAAASLKRAGGDVLKNKRDEKDAVRIQNRT